MGDDFEFGILGETIVQLHGQLDVQRIGAPRLRQTLAVLLTEPRRRVSFERLVRWIWREHERPPKNPESTFHTYGHRIRQLLLGSVSSARLITVDGGLLLDVDESVIDYGQFRELITRARFHHRRAEHEEALELVTAAVGLWRDRPLADLDSEPARDWRRRVVHDEWLPANELLLDTQIALGRYELALLRLGELDRRHRYEVGLVKRRLTVLHALARHSETTAYYLATHRWLREEARDEEAGELRAHHESLKRRAPVVRSEECQVPPRRLPREIADFTGRADLLDQLDALTGAGSVVALSGLGGVGKTATAVRWATRALRTGAGVLFVDLRGVSPTPRMEPRVAVESLLAQLGYPVAQVAGGAARARKLQELLDARPVPVILDNAENSAHVQALLPILGACPVVITSRQRLTELAMRQGIPSLTVGPLSPSEAVTLMAGRIRGRSGDEDVQPLAELCGGLPLALTVVAERAASRPEIPLRALANRLRDSTLLLSIGHDGDGPDSSLGAVFRLSYDALPAATGRLFRLLGVHPGAEFGVPAAAALGREPLPVTRRRLDELVGAHLLEQPGDVDRYRMHDLLLAFAAEEAEGDPEREQARERLYCHYLHTAHEAHQAVFPRLARPPLPPVVPGGEARTFSGEAEAMRWYRDERTNLTALIGHAIEAGLPGYAWLVPHLIAHAFTRMGFTSEIVGAYTAVVREAAGIDELSLASTLNDLGHFLVTIGDTAGAAGALHRAGEIVGRHDEPMAELTVRMNLAALAQREGRYEAAAERYGDCLRMARELGDDEREGKAEHGLGQSLARKRLLEPAAGHFERALRIRERLEDPAGRLATLTELCAVARMAGHHGRAEERGAQAAALFDQVQDVSGGLRLYLVLAELALDRNRLPDAVRCGRRVLELASPAADATAEAEGLDLLGQAWLRLGERKEARDAWQRAVGIFRDRGERWRASVLDRRLAELGPEPVIPAARDTSGEHVLWWPHSNR
ncbi:ATP-binding protein [Amycolatopsis alkalitolerans]|uniref:ATP-binding protein n=1 Tax=Amycolatopsis alkalitolerans TaxID=2547244 RepID=UPI0013589ADF|nr:tetratricopeptide repeat protein [Amycolatopsis alkalitolerans]